MINLKNLIFVALIHSLGVVTALGQVVDTNIYISGPGTSSDVLMQDNTTFRSAYVGNPDGIFLSTFDVQNTQTLSYIDVQSGGVNIGSSQPVTVYQGTTDPLTGYVASPNGLYIDSAYSALFSQSVSRSSVVGWSANYANTGSLSSVNGLIADSSGTQLQSATALTLSGSTITLTGTTAINTTGNASTTLGGLGTGSVTINSGTNSMSMSNNLLTITAPTTIVGTTLINTTGTANTAIGNANGTVTLSGSAVNLGTNSGSAVTVGSGTANSTVSLNGNRIQNVGNATSGTDAVNLNQLQSLTSNSSAQLASLQNQVSGLQSQINSSERGIAGVSAMTNIPSLSIGQQFNFGIGFGAFNANTAMALGAHLRIQENLIAKLTASMSANTYATGVGLAMGF